MKDRTRHPWIFGTAWHASQSFTTRLMLRGSLAGCQPSFASCMSKLASIRGNARDTDLRYDGLAFAGLSILVTGMVGHPDPCSLQSFGSIWADVCSYCKGQFVGTGGIKFPEVVVQVLYPRIYVIRLLTSSRSRLEEVLQCSGWNVCEKSLIMCSGPDQHCPTVHRVCNAWQEEGGGGRTRHR